MDEIAEGKGRKNVRQSKAKSMTPKPARGAEDSVDIANVHLRIPAASIGPMPELPRRIWPNIM